MKEWEKAMPEGWQELRALATPPKPNFYLRFDDMGYDEPSFMVFQFTVKKTLLARLKYWLFCKFFPFKIAKWE
jgi:hypothetical protein